MQIEAILVKILPCQTGNGKNGIWKKQELIFEINERFLRNICVSIWGDRINTNEFKIGETLSVYFDAESREFNGKWFTDLKAYNIARIAEALPVITPNPDIYFERGDDMDVLPF
jgi:hypothetical protein